MNITTKKNIRYYIAIIIGAIFVNISCTNDLNEGDGEIIFPESLTIEKILGITWKADRYSMKIITPTNINADSILPNEYKHLTVITEKLLNSIEFSKVGDVSVSYVAIKNEDKDSNGSLDIIENSVFYYNGKWKTNKDNKEEIFAKIDSPAGSLEFKIKIRELTILNKTLIMEAYFLNPKYSFSILFSGSGPQEEYWNKETDIIDPSWVERNEISEEPLSYSQIAGTYAINSKDWKRVIYIDDITQNIYPLLSQYNLNFESNGNIELSKLPSRFFGMNQYVGSWKINQNKVLINFPIFPFLGKVDKYGGVFELDYNPLLGPRYARHNVGITMEIVKIERERILVKLTELGMCSAYIYMNKL